MYRKFIQYIGQTSDNPLALEIIDADGLYMYGNSKNYIDCIAGIGVSNVGHNNKYIKEAVIQQLNKHSHLMVYGELIQQSQIALAEKLITILPDSLNQCYFVSTGSEAIEMAMKLAKRLTGRSHIVAQKDAYHGSTQGALSLMSNEYFSKNFYPLLPGIQFINQNEIENIDSIITTKTAAVFIEPIMGEKGYEPCNIEYLEALRKRCNETGSLLIFDEIQSGMGRTGKMFAFEHYNIVPDVLCLAKSLGGGLPLGAVIANQKILQCMTNNPVLGHISTFGGNPISCAAALASLNYILEFNLLQNAEKSEKIFRQKLNHPSIKSITGKGLMLAIHLGDSGKTRKVIDDCVSDGLLIDWFLYAENKIRIAPPLIINEQHIEKICNIVNLNIQKHFNEN